MRILIDEDAGQYRWRLVRRTPQGADLLARGVRAYPDEPNEELLRRVNATGQAYLTHTRVGGRYVLRLAIGSPFTREHHVAAVWDLIRELAGQRA